MTEAPIFMQLEHLRLARRYDLSLLEMLELLSWLIINKMMSKVEPEFENLVFRFMHCNALLTDGTVNPDYYT